MMCEGGKAGGKAGSGTYYTKLGLSAGSGKTGIILQLFTAIVRETCF